jgi:hypothetical protein
MVLLELVRQLRIASSFPLPSSLFPLPSFSYSFPSDLLLQNFTSMPREPETERTMPQSCFLCKEQSLETSGDLHQCLLCNRAYCDAHQGRFQGTCETNHQTYAHDHPDQPNVFPSLGERERTLMILQSPSGSSSEAPDRMTLATSPIGTEPLSIPLSQAGLTIGQVTSKPPAVGEPELAPPRVNTTVVEEKDVIGADTPV